MINFRLFEKLKDKTFKVIRNFFFEVDCDIRECHAHKYVQPNGLTKYMKAECFMQRGYERQDEYICLDVEEEKLLDFLNKKHLVKIDDNIEKIKEDQRNNTGYYEYQYEYEEEQRIPVIHGTGKDQTVDYIISYYTDYDWTTNINHSDLTGYRRYCDYEYTSYKVEKNYKDKYVLIPLEEQKDVLLNKDEYPYIKENYSVLVHYKREKFDIKEERERINGISLAKKRN